MRQRAPILLGSFCAVALLAGLLLWSARPPQGAPTGLPRRLPTATPSPVPPTPTPLPATHSPAPPQASQTPDGSEPKAAAWPALYALDERVHDAYTLKKLDDAAGLRAMLPELKAALDVVIAEKPAAFPGADEAWILRRQGDLRNAAPRLAAAAEQGDAEVLEAVEQVIQLVEVIMSAADTGHIAVTGGEVPWLKTAPMPQQPIDDSGDMVAEEGS